MKFNLNFETYMDHEPPCPRNELRWPYPPINNGLVELNAARQALGEKFAADIMSSNTQNYKPTYSKTLTETEAIKIGGFEHSSERHIIVRGDFGQFKGTKYIVDRNSITNAIISVEPVLCLDFEAIFKAWEKAGYPSPFLVRRSVRHRPKQTL